MFIPRQVQHRTSTIKRKRSFLAVAAQSDERQERRHPKKQRLDNASKLSTLKTVASTAIADTEHKIYYEEILCGLELLLSDYAYTQPESKKWLMERERRVEEEGGYIHLSAFLDSPAFARSSPPVTQTAIQNALELCRPDLLELSPDRYHVRRVCTSQPAGSPINWDAQTVYVEPHLSSLALSPPKLIHHLLSCHQALRSILPVQHVHVGKRPSYAFLILSAPVLEIEAHCWPANWVVLTKAEWRMRDLEYQALRMAESRPYYPIGKTSHRQRPTALVGANQTKTQPSITNQDYPTGHLVYLTNLHPSATKPSIVALISHHVDKYFGRLHKAQEQSRTVSKVSRAHSTPPASDPAPDTMSPKIMYTDYTAGTTTATIRLASAADADKVITALAARRIFHTIKDGSGVSVHDQDADDGQGSAITAELVTGKRESLYWEECVRKGKRGGKARKKDDCEANQEGLVCEDYGVEIYREKPRFKDSKNSNFREKSSRQHIKFEG